VEGSERSDNVGAPSHSEQLKIDKVAVKPPRICTFEACRPIRLRATSIPPDLLYKAPKREQRLLDIVVAPLCCATEAFALFLPSTPPAT
jgi:hypothetical protein